MLPLFVLGVKTKRFAKSAMNGKLNYKAKEIAPYAIGTIIAGWVVFISFI